MKQKTEKENIKPMLVYTAKKILWLVNYSLSFSKKDNGKEIGIKLLGCLIILQSISLFFIIVSTLLETILINPILTFGVIILGVVLVFKKEVSYFLKPKNQKKEVL